MQTSVINPNTTIRRYSLVVEADQRRTTALNAWKAAAEALLLGRNSITEARLIEAAEALKQANKDYYSVTKTVFPKAATAVCVHTHVKVHSRLYAAATRFTPAEYEQKAQCQDCGDWIDVEDIPEEAEVTS